MTAESQAVSNQTVQSKRVKSDGSVKASQIRRFSQRESSQWLYWENSVMITDSVMTPGSRSEQDAATLPASDVRSQCSLDAAVDHP